MAKLHKALQYRKYIRKGWMSKKAKRKTHNRFAKKTAQWIKIIGKFMDWNYQGIEKTIPLIVKYEGVITCLRNQLRFEDRWYEGDVIYSKYKTKEKLSGNLDYISDRWRCHYRLTWMLSLPEKYQNAPE